MTAQEYIWLYGTAWAKTEPFEIVNSELRFEAFRNMLRRLEDELGFDL